MENNSSISKNPKIEGTRIISCIPQRGLCPNNCSFCFFNANPYNNLEPIVPTIEETKGKIVRVNDINDSNNQKDLVIETTKNYEHKFYNTSISNFDFPDPVVFTCNGRTTDTDFIRTGDLIHRESNLMAVRIRTNYWNLRLVKEAAVYYALKEIPVILTFMRYPEESNLKDKYSYTYRQYISHSYWQLTSAAKQAIFTLIDNSVAQHQLMNRKEVKQMVYTCGTIRSPYCRDCGNCEKLFWRFYKNWRG